MRILYIDNRNYSHNADIHIDFFVYMGAKKYHQIIPYGKYLNRFFNQAQTPGKKPVQELEALVQKHRPDCIITYNCNGSSYEVKLDNPNLYQWCEEFLIKTSIPKFHFTTDYCRNGFRQEQADWFKKLNYTAAFFRHKVSLEHAIEIPAYWVPFSVDRSLYEKNAVTNLKKKELKVGFVGAAHNSAKDLYSNRIAAIDYLLGKHQLNITKIIDSKKFERKILHGADYVKFLTKNLFGLTCGGTCNFMTAKYFQIPAAASMLIGTNTKGLEIFPKETFIIYDKENLDEMYREIKYYENNLGDAKKKIFELQNYVLENHSHHQRILEFTKIIKSHI